MSKIKFAHVCILLCYLAGVTHAAAQVEYSKEQEQIRKKVNFYFKYGDYINAQDGYSSLYQFDSVSPELNFRFRHICIT